MNINVFEAIDNNNLGSVRYYLNQGGDVNATYYNGDSILIYALKKQMPPVNKYIILELINRGADLSAVDPATGDTPLHLAISINIMDRARQIEIIKALFANGADLDIRNIAGHSPGNMVAQHGPWVVEQLFDNERARRRLLRRIIKASHCLEVQERVQYHHFPRI